MKSWLKGGLIGIGIFLVLEILSLIFRGLPLKIFANYFGWIIITLFVSNRDLFYANYGSLSSTLIGFIFSLFTWFIVGLLITLIILEILKIFKDGRLKTSIIGGIVFDVIILIMGFSYLLPFEPFKSIYNVSGTFDSTSAMLLILLAFFIIGFVVVGMSVRFIKSSKAK